MQTIARFDIKESIYPLKVKHFHCQELQKNEEKKEKNAQTQPSEEMRQSEDDDEEEKTIESGI